MKKLTDRKDEKDKDNKDYKNKDNKDQEIELPKNIRDKLKEEAEKLVIKLEDEFIEIEDIDSTKGSKDSKDKNDQENSKKHYPISIIYEV